MNQFAQKSHWNSASKDNAFAEWFFKTVLYCAWKSCYKNWPVSQHNLFSMTSSLTNSMVWQTFLWGSQYATKRKECIQKKVRFYPHLHVGQPCRQGHTVDTECSVDGTWQIVTLSLSHLLCRQLLACELRSWYSELSNRHLLILWLSPLSGPSTVSLHPQHHGPRQQSSLYYFVYIRKF